MENRMSRTLLFACRNCDFQEEATNHCVYRNDIILPAIEQSRSYADFPSDPTLPRASKRACPKCKHFEAVFFQTHDRRRDTPMTLNFVCCNPSCNNVWNESDSIPVTAFSFFMTKFLFRRGFSSTIFALSTPLARSGICVFRISGPESLDTARKLTKKNLTSLEPRKVHQVAIYNGEKLLDSGLLTYFKAPKSFTGEDVIELSLHGSLAVIKEFSRLLVELKNPTLRQALPGEFTKRAVCNGKLSLIQAEGLAELLDAESEIELRSSQLMLNGTLDLHVRKWETWLIDKISEIEALIEFSHDHDLGAETTDSKAHLESLAYEISTIAELSKMRRDPSQNLKILIYGPPNSGKSSLLNYLAQKHVSIVSAKEGTTRDLIPLQLRLDGECVQFIDSAGVRETECEIEAEGVKMARDCFAEADVVLLLLNKKEDLPYFREYVLDPKTVPVMSKRDVREAILLPNVEGKYVFNISTVTGEGVLELVDAIKKISREKNNSKGEVRDELILTARQENCANQLRTVIDAALLINDLPLKIEFLKQALTILKELKGEFYNEDEIYEKIFKNFCIGK